MTRHFGKFYIKLEALEAYADTLICDLFSYMIITDVGKANSSKEYSDIKQNEIYSLRYTYVNSKVFP